MARKVRKKFAPHANVNTATCTCSVMTKDAGPTLAQAGSGEPGEQIKWVEVSSSQQLQIIQNRTPRNSLLRKWGPVDAPRIEPYMSPRNRKSSTPDVVHDSLAEGAVPAETLEGAFPHLDLPIQPPYPPMEAKSSRRYRKRVAINTNLSGTDFAAWHFATAQKLHCGRKRASHWRDISLSWWRPCGNSERGASYSMARS